MAGETGIAEIAVWESQKEAIEQEAGLLTKKIEDLQVFDPGTRQIAAGLMGKIALSKKEITRVWKIAKEPYKEKVAEIDGFFKPLVENLDAARTILDDKVKADYFKEQEKAREAQRKIDAEAEKARVQAEKAREKGQEKRADNLEAKAVILETTVQTAPETTVRGMAGGTLSMKKHWKHRVINPELVPDEYWVIDETLIRKAVVNGLRELPGVEIFEDVETSMRT